MSISLDDAPVAGGERGATVADLSLLSVAGFASLGAGAVHAAAAGNHSEHRQAVVAFSVVAALQLGWGALALVRRGRWFAGLGAGLNLAVLAGWVVAKTSGLGFIDGLAESGAVQRADAIAAAMAAIAVVVALRWLVGTYLGRRSPVGARGSVALGVVAAVVASAGMVAAGEHRHIGGDEHAHIAGDVDVPSAAPPEPYDPELPIDLGGVDGVTPQQQARAENLVTITLDRLPRFADPAVAEAAGFYSIGDGFTGHEHYMNDEYVADDVILDPDRPESLVFDTGVEPKRLVSVMYMLPPGSTLDDVPELGGALTQWHVHDNLCFNDLGRVSGTREPGGTCHGGLTPGGEVPMIHVWITPHPCGPFAALEGVAAGTIAPGEERLCDHAHGAP